MLVNADFSRCAVVVPDQYRWVASPQAGVERVMLDRLGGEKGRATSIVRYAPASCFPHHRHPGGEEILVLSGTFSEGEGREGEGREGEEHYPAGWYLRNPPGSSHRPFSDEGAVLFVKLRQMPPDEDRSVRIDTRDPSCWQRRQGREVCPLFSSEVERVALERLEAGEPLLTGPVAGTEALVIAGELRAGRQRYPCGSWIRLPAGEYPAFAAAGHGATLYLKTGHLAGATAWT